MIMAKKVYIAYVYGNHSVHAKQIIETNPDEIIIWSDAEYGALTIFIDLIAKISSYLKLNNKKLTILYPGPDKQLNENVYAVKNYGHYLISRPDVVDRNSQIDFSNIHLQSDKLYTLYCNRGSLERIKIIDTFAREGMINEGIVTFHGITMNGPANWQYHDGSPLKDEDDFVLHSQENFTPNNFPKSFFRGFADVVCESRVNNNEFFVSEKTVKSIAALKPFLVLSCQHYHEYLRYEYGILPYSEIFDYEFDSLPNIEDRIEGIVENIKRLKSIDKNEAHARIFDKLVHNKNQYIKYGTLREKMVPHAIEFMLNEPYELLGDVHAVDSWLTLVRKNGWL